MQSGESVTERMLCVEDGFLSAEQLKPIAQILRKPVWSFGWTSNPGTNHRPFWHVGLGDFRIAKCKNEITQSERRQLFAVRYPEIHEVWTRLRETYFNDGELLRVYANGHTFGLDGDIHRDSQRDAGEYTAIIYVNETWFSAWGGETQFFSEDMSRITQSIIPSPGRLAVFHGSIPHAAKAPSRDCPYLRTSLVFKIKSVFQ